MINNIQGINCTIDLVEYLFKINNYNGNNDKKENEIIVKGNNKTIITAPHSVNHFREGKIKYADCYTGSTALIIHHLTNSYTMCKTNSTEEDSNYDLECEFKNTLIKLIEEENLKYVIDLHGAGISRPFDIEIGTNNGKTIKEYKVEKIVEIFKNNNIVNIYINQLFKASHEGTITRYCSEKTKVESIQLEINRKFRDPQNNLENYIRLIKSLIEIINYLNNEEDVHE